MATEAQIAANRQNALRSGGPSSAGGKAHSARNALRHGLSAGLNDGTPMERRIAVLVDALIGKGPSNATTIGLARIVAEAQHAIERVGIQRCVAFQKHGWAGSGDELLTPTWEAWTAKVAEIIEELRRLDRYERRAMSRRRRALRDLDIFLARRAEAHAG